MLVFTQGTFDLFHIGHLNLLRRCKKLAGENGIVSVGLLTDEAIERYKGSKPIIPYQDRFKMLISCIYVDEVHFNEIADIKVALMKNEVDYVVVGSDWAKKDLAKHYGVEQHVLDDKVVYFPYTERESSTKIKERVKNG